MDQWSSVELAPDEVRAAASEHALGSRFVPYHARKSSVVGTVVGAVVVAFIPVVVIAVLLSIGSSGGGPLFFLMAGIVALSLVLIAVRTARSIAASNDALYLFDEGLVHNGRAGTRVFTWRRSSVWRKVVRTVTQIRGATIRTNYTYTLRSRDDEKVVLTQDEYSDIAEIGATIEQRIFDVHYPWALKVISSGKPLTYGHFFIDQHGISFGNDTVAWSGVAEVVIKNGTIGVRTARWERTYQIEGVPNVAVFAALAEELRQRAAAHES